MANKIDSTQFGRRVREARTSRHLTQAQLAEKLGVGNNYISMLERGKKQPSFETYLNLVLALEMPSDYFIMDYTPFGVLERSNQLNEELERLDIRQQQALLNIMEAVANGLKQT